MIDDDWNCCVTIDFKIDSPIYITSWFPMYICLPHWLAAALIPSWCCCNLWNWHIKIFKRCCNVSSFFIGLKPQTALLKPCRMPCGTFHSCMKDGNTIHPVLVPPRQLQQHLHLGPFARPCVVGTLVALLDAALAQNPFSLYLCGDGQNAPAKGQNFFENRHLGKHVRCEASLCVVFCCFCVFFHVFTQSN